MKELPAEGIVVRRSPIDGQGCFAARRFRAGAIIAEYVGERITGEEAARRLRGVRRIHVCSIDESRAIDGSRGGNGTQFINHSCDPNCAIIIRRGRIFFKALRVIRPDEEILLDYEVSWHSNAKRCHCGAPNCRGRINAL